MSKAREVAKMGEVLTNGQIGGRRNIIINGAMMVAQRSTSTQFSNGSGFVCDRYECSVSSNAAVTFSQSTDVPSGQGFINSTKINVDTADSSISGSEHSLFQQKVEGLNSSQLMWGTSNAENISVSFWIKSSLTGTFTYYALDQGANSQSYVQTFTIDSANTWEKKTFIIEGPTTGGTTDFPITNARSFFTGICLGVGSTHQTSTTGSWHSTTNFAASTSSAVKLIGTANANMYITGWQIELGNQVTPFEHRSFGEELLLCKRYYYKLGGDTAYQTVNTVVNFTGGTMLGHYQHPVQMRAAATITKTGNWSTLGGDTTVGQNVSADQNGPNTIQLGFSGGSGGTSGRASTLRWANDIGASLQFNAEL